MNITNLTPKGIDHILDNLWERGRRELAVCGVTVQELRAYCMKRLNDPWTAIFCDYDMTPCVMVLLHPIGENKYTVVSQATEEGFTKIWKPLARFLKQFSDQILQDHPDWEFQGWCVQSHDKLPDWMALLGFKLDRIDEDVQIYKKAVAL